MHFKILRSKDGEQPFYLTIVADNGKVLMTSETYHNIADVRNVEAIIRESAKDAELIIIDTKKKD